MVQSRKLKSYSYGAYTYGFISHKNGGAPRWCDSQLEVDRCCLAEFSKMITAYHCQPISMAYAGADGKAKRYTSDAYFISESVCHETGEVKNDAWFEEVKIAGLASTERFRESVERLSRLHMERYKAPLKLVTDKDFRVGSRMVNLRRLYKYKAVDTRHYQSSRTLPAIGGKILLSDLRQRMNSQGASPAIPFALLAHQILWFDDTIPLLDSTVLEVQP